MNQLKNSQAFSKKFSFGLLLAIVVLAFFFFYKVMYSFFIPLFLAAVLVVVFDPLHKKVSKRLNGRPQLTSAILTSFVFMVVLMPFVWMVSLAVQQGLDLPKQDLSKVSSKINEFRIKHKLKIPSEVEINSIETLLSANESELLINSEVKELQESVDELAIQLSVNGRLIKKNPNVDEINEVVVAMHESFFSESSSNDGSLDVSRKTMLIKVNRLKLLLAGNRPRLLMSEYSNINSPELRAVTKGLTGGLTSKLIGLTGATTSFLLSLLMHLIIMMIAVFYFFIDGKKLVRGAMALSPLENRHETELIDNFSNMSRAVVLASVLSALAQGFLAGIAFFFILGPGSWFVVTLLTIIFAFIPFVGATAVWLPISLFLIFIENRIGAGVFLAVWGLGVVSLSDNFIKPYVLNGQSNIHPLWALLSVIGGVQALGPIGVLVGPMIVAFLQALLVLLQKDIEKL